MSEIQDGFTPMIADIGIVGTFKETERSIIYLAPEVLENRMNCTKAADVYSFGIMMWEMWYGVQAFTELMPFDKATFQENIVAGNYRPEQDDLTISFPGAQNVMASCWQPHPQKRLSAKDCAAKLWEMCKQIQEKRRKPRESKTK